MLLQRSLIDIAPNERSSEKPKSGFQTTFRIAKPLIVD